MQEVYRLVGARRRLFQWLVPMYIIFYGCFMLPTYRTGLPVDANRLFIVVITYSLIGLLLAALMKRGAVKVFVLTLFLTAVGMGLRYLLEWGEVSNTMNFTLENIVLSLTVIPLGVTGVYWLVGRFWPEQ